MNGPVSKKGVIFLTKTPITKPFLTSDKKKEKSMLKSGIPDMILEKSFLNINRRLDTLSFK